MNLIKTIIQYKICTDNNFLTQISSPSTELLWQSNGESLYWNNWGDSYAPDLNYERGQNCAKQLQVGF